MLASRRMVERVADRIDGNVIELDAEVRKLADELERNKVAIVFLVVAVVALGAAVRRLSQ